MDKATVSRAVARLLRLGLLTRKPDPRDRRLLALDFTPRGRRAYARLVRLARSWEAWFTDGLDAGDRACLEQLLVKLARRLADVPQPQFTLRPAAGRRPARAP
jgi:DNA-binding MarR family transcriptional regulator